MDRVGAGPNNAAVFAAGVPVERVPKPFVIGVGLAVLLLLATLLPGWLARSSERRAAAQAAQKAEQARRQVHHYEPQLELLAARASAESLKQADLDTLVERSRDALRAVTKAAADMAAQARDADRQRHVEPAKIPTLTIDAGGVRNAIAGFERTQAANRARLQQAASLAQQATSTSSKAPGVALAAGSVHLAKAGQALDEALRLQRELATARADALAIAHAWADENSDRAQFAALDVTETRAALQQTLEDLRKSQAEETDRREKLRAAVAEREQALSQTQAQLKQARTGLLTLQEVGFKPGDDAAFDAYRRKFTDLSARLVRLQEQEQWLSDGGRAGASFADDDPFAGAIQGGQPSEGLQELRARLAVAEEKAAHFEQAIAATEARIRAVESSSADAGRQEKHYAQRSAAVKARVDAAIEKLATLAKQAGEKQNAALDAAKAAESAFRNARTAVADWVRAARELQSQDPQRKNERLRAILADSGAEALAQSAEAAARTLHGRILVERVRALSAYLDTLQRITRAVRDAKFETAGIEQTLSAAREEALTALGEARDIYSKLADRSAPTQWVHQAALAGVHHLLAAVDLPNAARHLADATEAARQAVTRREQSPYMTLHVRLLNHLTGRAAPPAPAPTPQPGSGQNPEDSTD